MHPGCDLRPCGAGGLARARGERTAGSAVDSRRWLASWWQTITTPCARALVLVLTRLGHEVQAVKGGAEALAAYRKRPADVVVTDLRMVPVDGIEVVRTAAGRGPRRHRAGDLGPRHHRHRRRGDARGGHRLPGEALPARRAAGAGGEGGPDRPRAARGPQRPGPGRGAGRGPGPRASARTAWWAARSRCAGCWSRSARWPPPTPPCCCWASRAPARSWWPAPSTTPARGATGRSSRSPAPPSPRGCSSRSCSATSAAPSPAR